MAPATVMDDEEIDTNRDAAPVDTNRDAAPVDTNQDQPTNLYLYFCNRTYALMTIGKLVNFLKVQLCGTLTVPH